MSAHVSDVNPVIDAVPGRGLPAAANIASIVMIVLGVFGLGYGFAVAGAVWTWGAYLVALVYVLAIAQGGIIFSIIQTGTGGRWGRPLKRVAESFAFFLPVAWVLLLIFLVLGLRVYPWNPNTIVDGGPVPLATHSPEAIASKELWLSPAFFVIRQLLGVGLLIALDFVYLRAAMRPDLVLAKARLGAKAPAWWGRIVGNATDVRAALAESQRTQALLVPFIGVSFALVFSMIAFDMIMSLSPWWYSNMFGGWVFVSSFWVSLAALALATMVGRDWMHLDGWVTTRVTHDLGKLMLAGCMFWAYTAFAQLLPIWYTDMPEETDYLLVRMALPQWSWLAKTVAICCFLAPFTILLSRGVKKMRWPFAGLAALIMVGIFLERTLLVMPSIYYGAEFPWMNFVLVSIPIWLGFLGLMIQVVGRVLAAMPALPVADPHLEPHPWDVHVHSLDAHGHH